jgi:hypothetical protein
MGHCFEISSPGCKRNTEAIDVAGVVGIVSVTSLRRVRSIDPP